MLCLLLLQSLREIEETLAVFVADSLLAMIRHLVSNCDLTLIRSMHFLRQELDLLMMEIAWTDQLSSVDTLLISCDFCSRLALDSASCLGLALYLASLIASLE